MKKVLIVLVLTVSSCGYAAPDNIKGIVVKNIESLSDHKCLYYGDGEDNHMGSIEFRFQIKDSCGKFNVGDTIKLTK